jgi:hypothetical protein
MKRLQADAQLYVAERQLFSPMHSRQLSVVCTVTPELLSLSAVSHLLVQAVTSYDAL